MMLILPELEVSCKLRIDLSILDFESSGPGLLRKSGSSRTYQTSLKIVLELNWDALQASILWQDKVVASGAVSYPTEDSFAYHVPY
jgi:hypothetical protein